MNILILPDGFKIENPCEGCGKPVKCTTDKAECIWMQRYQAQLSILSLCKEVDLNKAYKDYAPRNMHRRLETINGVTKEVTFEQFIQQEQQQESKDGE